MDAQDFRSLQEAYMEVVENQQLDEMPYIVMGSPDGNKEKKIGKPVKSRKYADARAAELEDTHKKTGGKYRSQYVESYDIYDIILSHLLDEGYAENVESAEAIMVNMSEDWRDEIVEEMLDEAKEDEDLTPLQKIRKRNKAYALPGEPAGQQTSNRRAERSSTRGVKRERGAKSAFGTMRNVGGPYN